MLWLNTSGRAAITRSMAGTVSQKIGRQHFDGGPSPFADGQHGAVKMIGPAIRQVVARDRSDDDVFQSQPGGGFGHPFGFVSFERLGLSLGDRAEAAGAACTRFPKS